MCIILGQRHNSEPMLAELLVVWSKRLLMCKPPHLILHPWLWSKSLNSTPGRGECPILACIMGMHPRPPTHPPLMHLHSYPFLTTACVHTKYKMGFYKMQLCCKWIIDGNFAIHRSSNKMKLTLQIFASECTQSHVWTFLIEQVKVICLNRSRFFPGGGVKAAMS